jgi:hypothetical protein
MVVIWPAADFKACGVATPSPLGAASSSHHGRCHMRLVWSKTVGKSGCVNERQPDDDDEMQISNI